MVYPDQMSDTTPGVRELDPLDLDPEVILVHELLHVSMWEMDYQVPEDIDHPKSLYQIGQERHIMVVSKVLVALDRRG